MEGPWAVIGTVVAAVAAVQLVSAAFREWSAARQIVSVDGLDADMYARHGCVPTQFAGSRFKVVRAAVAVTGFFTVGPKAPKRVFAACGIVGARGNDLIGYREVRPRDHLGVMLDEGEYAASFDRAMRRGIANLSRTIAIRDLSDPECDANAHCVTVRVRGNLVRAVAGSGDQWLEYQVTSAAPRGNSRSGLIPLTDVPADAIELVIVPQHAYEQARDDAIRQHTGRLRRLLLRHNPNPRVALAHLAARYVIPPVAVTGLAAAMLGRNAAAAIVFAAIALPVWLMLMAAIWSAPILFFMLVRHQFRKRRPRVEAARPARDETPFESKRLRRANLSPPRAWTGATSHTMSVGRIANATDARSLLAYAWQQYS